MKIHTEEWDNGNLIVNSEYTELLKGNDIETATSLFDLDSETVKAIVKERGTSRAVLKGNQGGVEVFIKRYSPVPLKEKIKLKLFRKPPTADAFDEWKAIVTFHEQALNTMIPIAVARIGEKTCNLTLGIQNYVRASDLLASFTAVDIDRKRNLLKNIAELSGKIHVGNMAHQDLYMVHFFVKEDEDDAVYLIDLQRTLIQKKLARRWHVKDLAQLLFSAGSTVDQDDINYFWDIYTGIVDVKLREDHVFINEVKSKADRINKRDLRKAAQRIANTSSK